MWVENTKKDRVFSAHNPSRVLRCRVSWEWKRGGQCVMCVVSAFKRISRILWVISFSCYIIVNYIKVEWVFCTFMIVFIELISKPSRFYLFSTDKRGKALNSAAILERNCHELSLYNLLLELIDRQCTR